MEFYSDAGGDPLKPSLFELVAQEQLRDLLQPALKYVLAVFAQRYPRYLLRIVNKHEEFYAAIMIIVEYHYLRKHNASFSEHFYGLKRRRRPYIETSRSQAAVGGVPSGESLRKAHILWSLLSLVVLPYARAKASELYDIWGGNVSQDLLEDGMDLEQTQVQVDQSVQGKLKRGFKRVYPWANFGFEAWMFTSNVAYLFDFTPFYRPWLAWMGLDIRRLGIEDYRAALTTMPAIRDPAPGTLRRIRHLLTSSPQLLLDSLRFLLPTAIFFIKFLEWWYSPNSPARAFAGVTRGPTVPPPAMLRPHPRGIPFDRSAYGQCPLCRQEVMNATVLPSGYVFCYRCAHRWVAEHGKCPITLLSCEEWQLRKVLV